MRFKKRRAEANVVTTVILTAVVLTIGCTIWSYAQSATTVIADNYVKGTLSLIDDIIERFTIERVFYLSSAQSLHVYVNNYGSVDTTVDLLVTLQDGSCLSVSGTNVLKSQVTCIPVSMTLSSGTAVGIKVHSRRGNDVYVNYVVP